MVLVAAHCVSDSPKQSISVAPKDDVDLPLAAENVIIHPEYNGTAPGGQHDLAVLKVKATDNDEHNYACLPEVGDDPMDGCQGGQLNLTHSKTNIYKIHILLQSGREVPLVCLDSTAPAASRSMGPEAMELLKLIASVTGHTGMVESFESKIKPGGFK